MRALIRFFLVYFINNLVHFRTAAIIFRLRLDRLNMHGDLGLIVSYRELETDGVEFSDAWTWHNDLLL
jgi:hypothetical protein